MGFLSLQTYNFRNLLEQEIPVGSENICFVGENGQGKTNLIEAVYFLCFASSFRTRQEKFLIKHGTSSLAVHGKFVRDGDGDEAGLSQSVSVKILNGKKEIRINDRGIRDRKEIVTNIPCIVFAHDDIFFVNGPPERKRLFFDQTMSLYDPLMIDNLRSYKKILKSRNILLKEGTRDTLDVLTMQLAEAGSVLTMKRHELVEEFNETFVPLYNKIFGYDLDVHIIYRPSWKNGEDPAAVFDYLQKNRQKDLLFETTTTGPHRDNFTFQSGTGDFSKVGSTGQLRLISLVLKIAQAVFFHKKTGKKPVLLLDDVLLELDTRKRETFFLSLPEYDQAFFTFLHSSDVGYLEEKNRIVYAVREGGVT